MFSSVKRPSRGEVAGLGQTNWSMSGKPGGIEQAALEKRIWLSAPDPDALKEESMIVSTKLLSVGSNLKSLKR